MDKIEGFMMLALQAAMVGFQRMYYRHSQPLLFENVVFILAETAEGRGDWEGQKFVFSISVLSERERKDACQAEIFIFTQPKQKDILAIAVDGVCRSPVNVLSVQGYANRWEEMIIKVFSGEPPNSLEITPGCNRLSLHLREFPVSELETNVNQYVEIRTTDWRFAEGRLNYFGPSATKLGDNFIIIDCGMTRTFHISEIEQAWVIDRRRIL